MENQSDAANIAPTRAQNMFDKEGVKRLELVLKSAPIPDRKMTKNEALQALTPELRKQLERGHTPDSIATVLSDAGMLVSGRTIGKMLHTMKAQKAPAVMPQVAH